MPVEPFNETTPPQTDKFPPVVYEKDTDINGEITGETIYPVLSDLVTPKGQTEADVLHRLREKCAAIDKLQINLSPEATGFLFWDLGEEDCERRDGGQWLPWNEIDHLHEYLSSVGVADCCITANGDNADRDKAARFIEANPPVPVIAMKNSGGASDYLAKLFDAHREKTEKSSSLSGAQIAKRKKLSRMSVQHLTKLAKAAGVDKYVLADVFDDDDGDDKLQLIELIMACEDDQHHHHHNGESAVRSSSFLNFADGQHSDGRISPMSIGSSLVAAGSQAWKRVIPKPGPSGSYMVRETDFLSHFYFKTIFLPRQARDKHRENSKKERFSQVGDTDWGDLLAAAHEEDLEASISLETSGMR